VRKVDDALPTAPTSAHEKMLYLLHQLNTRRRAIDIDIDTEITEINLTAFRDEVILFKELVTKITDFIDDLEEVFMWTRPVISGITFFVLLWMGFNNLQWALAPLFLFSRAAKLLNTRLQQSNELHNVEFTKAGAPVLPDDDSGSESSSSGDEDPTKEGDVTAVAEKIIKPKDGPVGRLERLRQMYTEFESDMRNAQTKVLTVHRFIRNKNTVLLKWQTLALCAVPKLTLTLAAVLALIGIGLCVLPFRFFFIVIVIHLFTKDMNFRKDPSPIDRFYQAIPIREDLENVINNDEEQSIVLSSFLRKPKENSERVQ